MSCRALGLSPDQLFQRAGLLPAEGDVLTIPGNPLNLSLCGTCLALLIADATGIRSATRERWAWMNRRESETRRKRLKELERKANEDLERVAKMDEGNGRGV